MIKRDPRRWMLHVECQKEDCIYNAEGHCQADYILIDRWEMCENYEQEEQPK